MILRNNYKEYTVKDKMRIFFLLSNVTNIPGRTSLYLQCESIINYFNV